MDGGGVVGIGRVCVEERWRVGMKVTSREGSISIDVWCDGE